MLKRVSFYWQLLFVHLSATDFTSEQTKPKLKAPPVSPSLVKLSWSTQLHHSHLVLNSSTHSL